MEVLVPVLVSWDGSRHRHSKFKGRASLPLEGADGVDIPIDNVQHLFEDNLKI